MCKIGNLSLEKIFGKDANWEGASLKNVKWMKNGSDFLYLEETEDGTAIYRENIGSENRQILLESSSLTSSSEGKLSIVNFQTTEDDRYFLISHEIRGNWKKPGKRSTKYSVYDSFTKDLKPLSDKEGEQKYAKFSSDGSKIAFVREGNIFVVDRETGVEKQITFDGSENILNGENKGFEEDGLLWSPDGESIVFVQADQSEVGSIPIVNYLKPYPEIHWIKYPKSGTPNWKLRVGLIELRTNDVSWFELGTDKDIYYPRIKWTRDPKLIAIERLNREQNKLELLFANINSGESKVVLTETDRCWVRIDDDLTFLESADQFIWTSQKSGYNHCYLYDYHGNLINQITDGEWEMGGARSPRAILSLDEKNKWIYFIGKKDCVIEQHIYRVKLNGKKLERLSEQPGWHEAEVSLDGKYMLKTFSDIHTPPEITLNHSDGRIIRTIKKSQAPNLEKCNLPRFEFLKLENREGIELNGMMIKPTKFNSERKYPVILYCYGGVSSQIVINKWTGARHIWHMYLAQNDFIVFSIDNRGTGGRGKEFENFMYKHLGTVPLEDHVDAVKFLNKLPYVDSSRVGIWGRSAGGYLTCLALTEGSEYFKVGVAHAPVTNYLFYSSVWSERYMGLPEKNEKTYEKEAVKSNINELEGSLLIVHGMADDNVQLQNTIEVASEFQEKDEKFDLMLYHGRDHALKGGNTSLHLFKLTTEYFSRNL